MNKSPLYIGLAAILAGGVAVAAWQGSRDEYADVVDVQPVMTQEQAYAQVLSTEPVTDVVTSPRQICHDVATQERLPERDGNVGGTVAGALIGALAGNQVGGGKGRQLATVAGAVAGGYAGREVDRRHVGGRVVAGTQRQCETISEAREKVVGYDVSYRSEDGQLGQIRTAKKPGERVELGLQDKIVGYDVTYQYQDLRRTVRMDQAPADRLPVIDGKVVLATDTPPMDTARASTDRG